MRCLLLLLLLQSTTTLVVPPARAPAVKHFINLSNGIEALEPLTRAGLPIEQVSFMRLQSSHCEAQDFYGILWNLDHNLLMHLALGASRLVHVLSFARSSRAHA